MPLSREQLDEIERRLEVANAIQRRMNSLSETVEQEKAPGGWVISEIHTPEYREQFLRLSQEWRAAQEALVDYLDSIVKA